MNYKESIYNIDIANYNNKILIYNSATSALALFNQEALSKFKNNNNISNIESLEGEISNGFIVKNDIDEVSIYMNKVWEYTHANNKKLHIVMVPSLACNYRCKYCFEESILSSNKYMESKLVDKSIEFIKKYLLENNCEYLTMEWFGGEPLLQKDIIFKVAPELINFCEKNNIKYNSHMISNGKLLTRDLALELIEKCKITMVQITLDGLSKNYADMKGCKESDFYTVIDNIKSLAKSGMKVNLRINISDKTKDEIKDLLKFIYIDNNIHTGFYLADVRDYTNNNYSIETYYEYKKELIKWIKSKPEIFMYMDLKLPMPRLSSCKATSKELLTIDYKGNIYQCAHMIDRFGLSGDIQNGLIEDAPERIKALDNKLPDKCLSCKILPICLGNCYADRALENIELNCDAYIKDIYHTIKLWYENIK